MKTDLTHTDELIYDWNETESAAPPPQPVEFDDETLRDGLQSPSAHNPSIQDKVEILHLMDCLGIETADIGLPGAGDQAATDVRALAREISASRLKVRPNCAARTVMSDVQAVVEITQQTGVEIEAYIFIGSSPIRAYVEGWDADMMRRHTRDSVTFAVTHDVPVAFVTEDSSRAHPDTLASLYEAAIDCGARRVCLCDTVGYSTPDGAHRLVSWMRDWLREKGFARIHLDWHGHMDRGLGIWNTVAAIQAGVDRVHGTALGIGERVGNTPMDLLLVNLQLMGWIDRDLSRLRDYCLKVAEACHVVVHPQYPVVGSSAFETAAGVHAAAITKALARGNRSLADRVYSAIPAEDFGLRQKIGVGPMSGRANVVFWLKEHGVEPAEGLIETVLRAAKRSDCLLSDEELWQLATGFRG